MNLNVTLEFACYTQYGVYMYLFIYGKTLGPTITANCGRTIFTKNKNTKRILHHVTVSNNYKTKLNYYCHTNPLTTNSHNNY